MHKFIRESPDGYKEVLKVAENIKSKALKRKAKIKKYSEENKKMIELYFNRRVVNGVYYP